ncbi:MAG: CRISPR-associated helicase Cas3' [Truepera sp.]|nr:CRISPR-associated helicase Cas3' [Truepera sp.]
MLYSHPDKLLVDHVREVGEAASIILQRHSLPDTIMECVRELVRLHDFGKATRFFQEYIRFKPEPRRWPGRPELKAHTALGALACAIVKRTHSLSDEWLIQVGSSVMGHHTHLPTRNDIDNRFMSDTHSSALIQQLTDLPLTALIELTGFPLHPEDFRADEETIFATTDAYRDAFDTLDKQPIAEAARLHLATQLVFSVLLEADKAFLALSEEARYAYAYRAAKRIAPSVVDGYLAEAEATPINELRSRARHNALRELSNNSNANLFTLTLPTGMGKTLTAKSLALHLREESARQIIVVLPFLSIIDQTATVYADVLGRPGEDVLMQSHSLSARDYLDLEDEDASFFLDTWQSDIVITTFDQFLLALLGSNTKHQMRFHHLTDAIVIFDEVQALPSHLWDIMHHALRALTDKFGTSVIAMSATQPGFVQGALELVSDVQAIFKRFGRYRLALKHYQDVPIGEFVDLVHGRHDDLRHKRALITCNTRRSARRLYDELCGWSSDDYPVHFLSADVTPKDRLAVISRLKESYPNPCLVISTQVVEAGVDIDMDLVMRDFAPLDAIIQVAGRCNRNDRKPRCDVEVYSLVNDKGKRYSELIYRSGGGPDLSLQETRRALEGLEFIPEEEVLVLAERYFANIRNAKNLGQEHTRNWAYFREHLNVSRLLRGDQDRQHQFIVAERGDVEPSLETTVRAVLSIEDRWERRRDLRRLAPRLAQVTVNVWEQRGFNPENIAYQVGPFWFVREGFYDDKRGLDIAVGHADDAAII